MSALSVEGITTSQSGRAGSDSTDFRDPNKWFEMNFCKKQIIIDRLADDQMATLESCLRDGTMLPYTGTISEQSALKAYFQEFEIVSDEELALLVSRRDNLGNSNEIMNFTFLRKYDYERLLDRIAQC